MEYVKSKRTGSVFEVKYEGENYVHGILKGKPAISIYSINISRADTEPYDPTPKVGDMVTYCGNEGEVVYQYNNQSVVLVRGLLYAYYTSTLTKVE